MSSYVQQLDKQNLISPPKWLPNSVQYEVIMGSLAYGVSNDNSDMDIYGFCIPHKDSVFPHLKGEIRGFGSQTDVFGQWQQHHIMSQDGTQEYDFAIYNIIKYFQLCMENNPNMIDSLFVPQRCIVHSTRIGNLVRDNRHLFLHKGAWHKFKGYSYSQLNKMQGKALKKFVEWCKKHEIPYNSTIEDFDNAFHMEYNDAIQMEDELLTSLIHLDVDVLNEGRCHLKQCTQNGVVSKRLDSVAEHGYDVKFAYHVVRLLNEVEQIMTEENIDLERCREQLKSIRRCEWTLEQIQDWFAQKEKSLGDLYNTSKLRHSPDEEAIKNLLMNCLEEYYGSLDKCIINPDKATQALKDIQKVVENYNN